MELKPCPFCGGEAKLYERKDERPSGRWYVECTGFEKCDVLPHTYPATKLEAIEAWNTRAERTCRIVKTWSDSDYVDGWRYRCSECMCFIPVNERDLGTGEVISAANYCPNCGAKVVE